MISFFSWDGGRVRRALERAPGPRLGVRTTKSKYQDGVNTPGKASMTTFGLPVVVFFEFIKLCATRIADSGERIDIRSRTTGAPYGKRESHLSIGGRGGRLE
jgi:hypothetical protein